MYLQFDLHFQFYSSHVDQKKPEYDEVQSSLNHHSLLSKQEEEQHQHLTGDYPRERFLLHNVRIPRHRNFRNQKTHEALPRRKSHFF